MMEFTGEYSPMKMVERAVRQARHHSAMDCQRWVAVRDVFGWGSTTSIRMCEHFGLNPYEEVRGIHCQSCDELAREIEADLQANEQED